MNDIDTGDHVHHAPSGEDWVVAYVRGDRIIYCCFPDCGCDGARLCQAEKGANSSARTMNIERGSLKA